MRDNSSEVRYPASGLYLKMMSFYSTVRLTLRTVTSVAALRTGLFVACVLVLLFLPAFAQQGPVVVQPGAPGQPTRILPSNTKATLPPPSPADAKFMEGMIMHHAQAVEMTALIESRTENRELRTLGARISKSQADEIAFMKRWLGAREQKAEGSGQKAGSGHNMHNMPGMHADQKPNTDEKPAPPSHQMPPTHDIHMSSDHTLMPGMLTAKQMEELRNAKGEEFDRLFLSGMIQHHNGALIMVKELFDTAGSGQDAELFNFVTDVDSGQRAEIRIMQNMLGEK